MANQYEHGVAGTASLPGSGYDPYDTNATLRPASAPQVRRNIDTLRELSARIRQQRTLAEDTGC